MKALLFCFWAGKLKFSDVEVGVAWQWYNSILREADAAGKELLLINLDETFVPGRILRDSLQGVDSSA